MDTKRSKTEIRKVRIAQKVSEFTADNDCKRPDMAKVAERFGISQSTIDRYFNPMDNTFDSVLHVIHSKLHDNFKSVYEETSDPLKQLELVLIHHTELLKENPSIMRLMLSEDVFNDSREKRAKVQNTATDYASKLTELILQCQRKNKLRSDIDANMVSLILLGTVQLRALLFHFSSGGFDVPRPEKWRAK